MGATSPAKDGTSRPDRLTAAFARDVAGPGVSSDGRGVHGLHLMVGPRAAGGVRNTWMQRPRVNGRPVKLSLGIYPVITLADARDALGDLGPRRDRERVPTLAEAFQSVVALHAANRSGFGRSKQQWRSSVATYVLPRFGAKSVADVTAGDILAVLTPLWADKAETARRLRGRSTAPTTPPPPATPSVASKAPTNAATSSKPAAPSRKTGPTTAPPENTQTDHMNPGRPSLVVRE